MSNIRALDKKKYDISKHRYMELLHHCLQYPEWKEELKNQTHTVRSVNISDLPVSTVKSNPTEELAIRRLQLRAKCEMIEQTVLETDEELYQYILLGVTEEYASYNYLHMMKDIPCSHNTYYARKRKFFYLLSKKI